MKIVGTFVTDLRKAAICGHLNKYKCTGIKVITHESKPSYVLAT